MKTPMTLMTDNGNEWVSPREKVYIAAARYGLAKACEGMVPWGMQPKVSEEDLLKKNAAIIAEAKKNLDEALDAFIADDGANDPGKAR